MMDSIDQLAKLEDKLLRAVEVFKKTQAERRGAEQELEELRAESKERSKKVEALEREIQVLRREREEVRARIERLLEHIEELTKENAGG